MLKKTKPIDYYDLIIFDCDGTLVDSEHISNALIAVMIREIGINISNKEAFELFAGTSFAKITSYIEAQLKSKLTIDFEKEFRERVKVKFEQELKPIPGVKDFIENLDQLICVASNGNSEKMLMTLEITGLLKHFSNNNMFSAHDIQKWKPEPDLFLHAAKSMHVDPSKCLVIEDTIPGALGALNGQIDVLVYVGDQNPKAFHDLDVSTFTNFNELI